MKTKPFLLATAGSTVDGRVIDEKMLKEMASSYDPKTYGARLNIEHIRGISGQAPFRAYGDVLELSTDEVEVNFNGKIEKRLGLFGVFDVTEEAKKLNEEGQKVYSSIEIEPDFGGKGFAYLMGAALTDSPASIATERLEFNRVQPGMITLARGDAGQPEAAAPIEFDVATPDASANFLSGLGTVLDKYFGKKEEPAAPKKDEPKEPAPAEFSAESLKPLFEGLGESFATAIGQLRNDVNAQIDQLSVKVKAVETSIEETPSAAYSKRPDAAGKGRNFAGF